MFKSLPNEVWKKLITIGNYLNKVQKYHKYIYPIVVLGVILFNVMVPSDIIVAQKEGSIFTSLLPRNLPVVREINYKKDFPNQLPEAESLPAKRVTYVTATSYSSTPDQTDSTPCITANGFDLCEHNRENIIATNALPFGTRVRFPEVYGDEIFYVMDRMNARYNTRVDFWKKTREDAKIFGLKHVKMEVL